MGLFDNQPLVQLAVDVGRLTELVAALSRRVEQAEAKAEQAMAQTKHTPIALSANIAAVVEQLSAGDNTLARHLEQEARASLAMGVEERHVIELLRMGSR